MSVQGYKLCHLNKNDLRDIIYNYMEKKRSVTVLFLGSIQRSEECAVSEKPTDEIDFGRPVRVSLVRIPKPKRQLYGRHTSVTQSEPIKGFEIYFRNLEETGGRFSLLTCSNDFMITSTQDVLITPAKPFLTDLLVVRGAFVRLSLCIYGSIAQSGNLWQRDAPIAQTGMAMEIKRNIFEQKRRCIHIIGAESEGRVSESVNLSTADSWQQATNDDDINEPQIKNICHIAQHLLNTFQQIDDDQYIVKFREHIENINNHLQKLFKSKQIGLYYPKQQNFTIQNQIPLPLVHIARSALKLVLSDQYRVLEMLKMLAQLPRHANALIQAGGVTQLSALFIEIYKPNAVYFSTFKNLVLEVCIALAQWPAAAQKMVTKMQQDFPQDLYQPLPSKQAEQRKLLEARQREAAREKERLKQAEKQRSREKLRSRSRDRGKQKRSKSQDSDSQIQSKRKKRQKKQKKQKKRRGERQRQRSKKKGDRQRKRDKKQQTKPKQQKSVKKEEALSPLKADSSISQPPLNKLSFYQLLFFILLQQKNSKTLNLIKILIEQITQTLTKNKEISEQIAHVTTFLRDTKYLFNQGTEIINSKSLKIFATFQPFLNDNQSENVDCRYISEREKLKNPLRYGINPKTFKILNKINQEIVTNGHKEALGIGTPFDQHFMVMMSELIFEKEKPILTGFNRIVNAFRADGLMHLQRNEAAISIIADYIYKALLDDEGINTFVYIEQIHGSLIKFIGLLNEDPSLFSTELKSRIKLLSNYATPYDHFSRAEGAFKVFCQYFLRLFKYENYEIEINNKAKLTDFRKKEYEKLINPFTFDNLSENYAMKNFNDVSSNQPLVEIDVCLKIFLILCEYNKNIWTTFYENKLISGFSSLLNKVSNLLLFYLDNSANRWTSYSNAKSYLLNLDNYLTVTKHVLMLMAKKCRYESAYNDLLEQDIFQDVQLYEKSIEIYIHLYNALHDDCMMVYTNKSRNKIKCILALVIEILDQFLTAYELIPHQTRQQKLKRLMEYIYVLHYSSLKSRSAILSIYSQIIRLAEGATCKYLSIHILDSHFTLSKLFENQVAYIPTNDRSMIENIIKSNLYRASPIITNNLAALVRNLFTKAQYVDRTLDIIERLFDEIDQEYKKNEEENGQIGWKNLRKAHLFTEVLVKTESTFKSRLDDKLMRFFKRILDSYRRRVDVRDIAERIEEDNFIVFLKIKNNFMTYFTRLLKESQENSTILLQFYESTVRSLSLEYFIFEANNGLNDFQAKVNLQALKGCSIYTQGLADIGLIGSYQCFLLYGELMEKPYKPQTFISFVDIISHLERLILSKLYKEDSLEMKQVGRIVSSIFYFLCTLTSINGEDLFTTESRRGAIIHLLLPNEKDFPFNAIRSSSLGRFIPKEYIKLLEEYFSYPIVEKPIILKPKPEIKPPGKTKSAIYSKSIFSIISEHDPVSKTRYKFIGGEWVGGDIEKGLYTPFRSRNYEEEIERYVMAKVSNSYEEYHYRQYSFIKEDIQFNELFYLSTRKDRQEAPKKEVERTIQLKDVVPRMTPQQNKKDNLKPSPSPSKMINNMNSNLGSPQSSNNSVPMQSPMGKQMSGEKNYNRSSNPRSNSQNSNQPNYNPNNYYNPNQRQPQQPANMNTHYNSSVPNPSMHTYPPSSYPPHYYNPPPTMYTPNPHQRYPQPYQPMPHSMYPPQAMSKPVPSMYPPATMGAMYPPIGQSQLNQYEQQMFQQAYVLVNEMKNSNLNLSQQEINMKKNRLNYILSSHPKVHTKLKDSLLPQQS